MHPSCTRGCDGDWMHAFRWVALTVVPSVECKLELAITNPKVFSCCHDVFTFGFYGFCFLKTMTVIRSLHLSLGHL